jgi:SAM-dependent methyltransferase
MVAPCSHAELMALEAHQWDEHSARYDRQRSRDAIYRAGVEAAAEALAVQPGERILEAGCGTGMVLKRYLRPRIEAVALDLSLDSLKRLPSSVSGSRIRPVRGSVDRLPFNDAIFDRVICANTLQHLPTEEKRRRAISELARVARPGARVVVTVHNWSVPKKWAGEPKEGPAGSLSGPIQYIHRFDIDEFTTLLRSKLDVLWVVGAGLPFPYRFKLSALSRILERFSRSWRASAAWGNMLVGVGYTREG